MTLAPLWVEFCGNAAEVMCPEGTFRETLERLLVDCRTANHAGPVAATYRVSVPAPDLVKVERDDDVIYDGRAADWVVLFLLQNVTSALIAGCRRDMNIHSAGLAHGGRGILLCGASGSGKSTLAAWLAGSGFQFLTDELVGITIDGGSMTGLARPIHLKRGSEFVLDRWLGDDSRDSLCVLQDGSTLVPPSVLAGARVIRTTVPEIVVFPKYGAQSDFQAQRLSSANTAFRLAHCLVNAVNLEGHGMGQVVALAKRVTGYSVEFSRPEAVADWLCQTLGRR